MRSTRSLAIATAIMFCASTLFPVVAALSRDAASLPGIVGVMDGILAFALVFMAMLLYARTEGKVTREAHEAAYRAYRVLMHAILGLLIVFFLFGDRVVWHIALVGLAWRAWLLLYTLPSWYAALKETA